MTTKRQPRELPRRQYDLVLKDELAGFHVKIGAMRGHELIRIRRDGLNEADVIDLVAERVIEHDFPVDDLRDLDYWALTAILEAWTDAMQETAVPPTTGES